MGSGSGTSSEPEPCPPLHGPFTALPHRTTGKNLVIIQDVNNGLIALVLVIYSSPITAIKKWDSLHPNRSTLSNVIIRPCLPLGSSMCNSPFSVEKQNTILNFSWEFHENRSFTEVQQNPSIVLVDASSLLIPSQA